MDYLGWELERQRAALAALLLGGGNTRDRESVRDEARWSGPGTPEPYTRHSRQAPKPWEAIRENRQEQEDGGVVSTVETPVSAWEAVLGGEETRAIRQDGRESGGAGTSEMPTSAWETILSGDMGSPVNSAAGARLRLSGGTGAQPEFLRPSGGYMSRSGMGQAGADLTAKAQVTESGQDDAGDRAASSEAGTNQNRAAGDTAADRHSGRFFRVRRGGEYTVDMLDLDGMTASQEMAKRTALWGGGWGAAILRAEESAKAMSRAVQRDARRYDGGFNIF